MNILATQYTLQFKSLDIYIAGCVGKCEKCHNPESWEFNQGVKYDTSYFMRIKDKVKHFDSMIDNIMIFGGEPLDQSISDLVEMLFELNTLNKNIWLFTRFPLEEVPQCIKNYCQYIKCGPYIPSLTCENNEMYGVKLATSNQYIYKKDIDY